MSTGPAAVRILLLFGLAAAVFVKVFLYAPWAPWGGRFELLNVPVFEWPGADARNIQMAAHCARAGHPLHGRNDCMKAAAPVRAHHPGAQVPELNYPSHWVRIYGLFGDDSERFFALWWRLNGLLLLAALLACCWRYNPMVLPLFLFSPVALLAVERGNNDATTFFFTFVPLLAFAGSVRLQSLAIGFAAALKIFPAAGWLAFARSRAPFVQKGALAGALLAAPLVAVSLLELPHLLQGTGRGFWFSYGLPSLRHAAVIEDHPVVGWLLTAGVLAAMAGAAVALFRDGPARRAVERNLSQLRPADLTVLLVSLSIFLATFLLFTSWAYRLIFLIPAFLVLSRGTGSVARLTCLNILAVFWLPFLEHGWLWLNFACYPLAVLAAALLPVGLHHASLRSPG